jgi:hypothetical protein
VPRAISNTSPLLYLYRTGILGWLEKLFTSIWIPGAVVHELNQGRLKGYDVPNPNQCGWIRIAEPLAVPAEWFALDLGPGELAAVSLALENPSFVVLLDDALARRIAQAAGLTVWGTLRVLLEAKSHGLADSIGPFIPRLRAAGMWISEDVQRRVLTLAREPMN